MKCEFCQTEMEREEVDGGLYCDNPECEVNLTTDDEEDDPYCDEYAEDDTIN